MNDDVVSIIIPVYNVEKYLRQCLDSVTSQTYKSLDVILVDDGSTDASGAICDEYTDGDTRIRVFHTENTGQSGARNRGFDAAEGKYVLFLDSDDFLLSDTVEKLVSKAVADSCDMVIFNADCLYEYGKAPKKAQRYHRSGEYKTASGMEMFERLNENGEYHATVCMALYRRAFLAGANIRFPVGITYEDVIYIYAAFVKAERVAYIPRSFYQRRYRANSQTTSALTTYNFISMAAVYERVLAFTEENGLLSNAACRKYVVRCASNVINCYRRLTRADRRKTKALYKKETDDMIKRGAFFDGALRMKIRGEAFWFIYKAFHRITGREGKRGL